MMGVFDKIFHRKQENTSYSTITPTKIITEHSNVQPRTFITTPITKDPKLEKKLQTINFKLIQTTKRQREERLIHHTREEQKLAKELEKIEREIAILEGRDLSVFEKKTKSKMAHEKPFDIEEFIESPHVHAKINKSILKKESLMGQNLTKTLHSFKENITNLTPPLQKNEIQKKTSTLPPHKRPLDQHHAPLHTKPSIKPYHLPPHKKYRSPEISSTSYQKKTEYRSINQESTNNQLELAILELQAKWQIAKANKQTLNNESRSDITLPDTSNITLSDASNITLPDTSNITLPDTSNITLPAVHKNSSKQHKVKRKSIVKNSPPRTEE